MCWMQLRWQPSQLNQAKNLAWWIKLVCSILVASCVLCFYVMNVFKVKCSGIITNRLPSGRSRPLADVARFLEPSLSSRSELRRVNCVPLPYDTFDMDVDRRWLQYEVFGDARFTSTGSNRRGVDEPNANDCKIQKRKKTTKKRWSMTWLRDDDGEILIYLVYLTIELRSLRRFVSNRASRSWFFRTIYSRRSRSASNIAFFRSST